MDRQRAGARIIRVGVLAAGLACAAGAAAVDATGVRIGLRLAASCTVTARAVAAGTRGVACSRPVPHDVRTSLEVARLGGSAERAVRPPRVKVVTVTF